MPLERISAIEICRGILRNITGDGTPQRGPAVGFFAPALRDTVSYITNLTPGEPVDQFALGAALSEFERFLRNQLSYMLGLLSVYTEGTTLTFALRLLKGCCDEATFQRAAEDAEEAQSKLPPQKNAPPPWTKTSGTSLAAVQWLLGTCRDQSTWQKALESIKQEVSLHKATYAESPDYGKTAATNLSVIATEHTAAAMLRSCSAPGEKMSAERKLERLQVVVQEADRAVQYALECPKYAADGNNIFAAMVANARVWD